MHTYEVPHNSQLPPLEPQCLVATRARKSGDRPRTPSRLLECPAEINFLFSRRFRIKSQFRVGTSMGSTAILFTSEEPRNDGPCLKVS